MRKYLATIHQRSPEHKKRFALFVSSAVTLVIFTIWSMATFGPGESTLATNEAEYTPFESLKASVGSVLKILRHDTEELKAGLETVQRQYDR